MKNKWISIMLGMVLCAAVTGCSGTKGTDSSTSAESTQEEMSAVVDTDNTQKEMEESDFGEVTEIGENTLTVALRTRQESSEQKMLTITEDTKITRQGKGGGPGGNAGEMMEKPDGEAESQMPQEDGQGGPQMQDGEEREAPEMPEGGMGGGEEITLEDIAVGDMISFTLDEDGNAKTIQVMSGGMEEL